MRSLHTLAIPFLLSSTLFAQWNPLSTGMLSNRSLCAQNGDLYCATYPNGVKKSANGTGPFTAVNTGLPVSGSNYFVQSVGSIGGALYAGTESGIYRSDNGGASWTIANGSLAASASVYANKFFSAGGNVLAVFDGSIAQGGGIWRSGDAGNTWLIGHSGMGSNAVVHHLTQVGNTLWASTSVGLYTSTDNAQNWTAIPSVNYAVYSLAALNNTLVIASNFGMRYSTNGGTSWMDSSGDPNSLTDGELVAFDGKLFALLNPPTGCLRSLDNGVTWSDYNAGFSPVDAQAQEEFLVAGNTLYCTALFDIYSLEGTSTALAPAPVRGGIIAFPTVFNDGFTVRNAPASGTLFLVDAAGRTVRSVAISAARDVWVDRSGLAPGGYHAYFVDRPSGDRIPLGTLVAQ